MNGVVYGKASESDFAELKKLWIEVFEELPEAAELFFERNKAYTHAYCAKHNSELAAAVYLVDGSLNGKRAHYLCGAATRADCRKRGVMSGLIRFALADAAERGDAFSLLFPANETLYAFYKRLGYEEKCFCKRIIINRETAAAALEKSGKSADYESLQRLCHKDNFLLQNNNFVRFAADYYSLYGARVVESENAFTIFEEEGERAEVYYAIYNDIKELKTLLFSNSGANSFFVTVKDGGDFPDAVSERHGMIKLLDKNEDLPNSVFIGITLN